VLVVQADSFNRSRIQTAIVAVITGNLELADVSGNVLVPARSTGLLRDSVVNVSQLPTLDRSFLTEHARTLPRGGHRPFSTAVSRSGDVTTRDFHQRHPVELGNVIDVLRK
jgi:hypothetical protein